MCGSLDYGDLGALNIELKINALRLGSKYLFEIFFLGSNAKWFYFARYFLRHFNADLYSRNRPHVICKLPLFYSSLHSLHFQLLSVTVVISNCFRSGKL